MSDKQKLISVIIPVYNTAEYLPRCLDSVINNGYKNLEIICVNDGSTDSSPEILRGYEKKDNRIKVIDVPNGGVSRARNIGLDNASGEYIAFIDSDDWIALNYFEILSDSAMKCGIGVCGYKQTDRFEDDFVSLPIKQAVVKPEDIYCDKLIITIAPWGKLYNKESFRELRFPEGKLYEDEYVTYKVLFEYKQIAYIDEPLYYYFSNPHGATKAKWTLKKLDKLEAIEEQIRFFKEQSFKRAYKRAIAYYYSSACSFYNQAKKANRKQEIRIVKKLINKHRLRYGLQLIQYRLKRR